MKQLPLESAEMHALAAALRKISLFKDISMRDLERLLTATTLWEYPAGATVFKKGEVGDALYIVHRGSVDIVMPRFLFPAKRVASLNAGEFFGEMALLKQPYRTATARTREPSALFVLLSTHFNEIFSDNPDFLRALEDTAARRAFETKSKLER